MKTKSLLLVSALLLTIFTNAQSTFNRKIINAKAVKYSLNKTSLEYLPLTTANFWWDEMLAEWESGDSTFTQYDSKGNVLQTENRIPSGTSSFKSRNNYTYDLNDNQLTSVFLNWNPNTSAWDSSSKTSATYDSNGSITESKFYFYNQQTGTWELNDGFKGKYIYNNSGVLLEEIFQNWVEHLNAYRNSRKSVYSYNAQGKPSEIVDMEWDTLSSTFKNSSKVINIVWYKWQNNWESSLPLSYLIQLWDSSAYVDDYKGSHKYDTQGNEIEYTAERWNGTDWEIEYKEKYINTYNINNAMIESIGQNYDIATSTFENSFKRVLSNFFIFNNLSEKTLTSSDLIIYPNPITENATIKINQKINSGKCVFAVYSIFGQLVNSQIIENGEATFKKDNLNAGIYFYRLTENNQSIASGKLVIE